MWKFLSREMACKHLFGERRCVCGWQRVFTHISLIRALAVAWERVFGILCKGETELLVTGMKHQEQNSPQILSSGEVGNEMLASS